MPYDDRKKLIQAIEGLRDDRTLVSLCNFDRASNPELPGLATMLTADLKESLYRILKESPTEKGVDIFLYTRGGDTNSVWPIARLLQDFDKNFEVLVPFRAHSAGTMLALGANKIVMTRLGELSPIDATTGNQFNPLDPARKGKRLGISVEDVRAYQDFLADAFGLNREGASEDADIGQRRALLPPFIQRLVDTTHPLALGNVHRVHQLISRLAKKLLQFHSTPGQDLDAVVRALTVEAFSHQHMIGAEEAIEALGSGLVEKASEDLESKLDELLKRYEDDFHLRTPLFGPRFMGTSASEKDFRFIGGAIESRHWGYLFETKGKIIQHSKLPPGVNVQIQPGQPMPLVPGLPREYSLEVHEQRWHRNTQPEGVTI